jgi:lysophospholipase L1-like esterase
MNHIKFLKVLINKKKIIFIIPIISILIVFLEQYANYKSPSWHKSDLELGWVLKKNFKHTYTFVDYLGNIYDSKFSTDQNGFRNYSTSEKELGETFLVIGDSFVADPYSGNEEMWYSQMIKSLKEQNKKNYTVYGAGGGGYGTLQEYLLLKRIIENKKFDYYILQFCSNDFNNNNYSIEKKGLVYNQFFRRPFLDIKTKTIFFDQSIIAKISRNAFFGDSKIFNKIIHQISLIKKNKQIPYEVTEEIKNESYEATLYLLHEMKKLVENKKFFMVNCDAKNGLNKDWDKVAKELNYIPIVEPSEKIFLYSLNNKDIFFLDGGHYNNKGNKIFGTEIAKFILSYL